MGEIFKSKFCLPKRIPPFLQEYFEYMTAQRSVPREPLDVTQRLMTQNWADYSSSGKERKKREKKTDGTGAGAGDAAEAGEKTGETRAKTIGKFRKFVAQQVQDRALQAQIIELLNEYCRTVVPE